MKKSIEISPNIETLFGTRDENLHVLEDGLNINIDLRSDALELEGTPRDVARAEQVFADYDQLQRSGYVFNNGDLNSMLRVLVADPKVTLRGLAEAGRQRSLGRRTVQPKSSNQRKYLDAIEATFPYLVPDPVVPAADEYQRKLSFEITEALAKRKSPKEALDTAAVEWDKVTERRGRDKQKAAWGEKLAEMKALGIEYHPDWAAKAK